jgi:preprotein translocase subunit SecA
MKFLNKLLASFVGNKNLKDLQELRPIVAEVNEVYAGLQALDHDGLRAYSIALKEKIRAAAEPLQKRQEELKNKAESDVSLSDTEKEQIYLEIDSIEKEILGVLDQKLNENEAAAFALVKETARRWSAGETLRVKATDFDRELNEMGRPVQIEGDFALWPPHWDAAGTRVDWNMLHYDVQLIGGRVLHRGKIAEMATGEGKTLVGTLPIYLNALAGRGVHVVTVNDYLARRDSEWMGPLFEFHGLRVDCIDKHSPNSFERRNAYLADITYGTNNEFGFDYLRDNMVTHPDQLVQRGHHFAIIDEVDSVLIDEARTPLIISGPTPKGNNQEYLSLKPQVEKLMAAQKKIVNQQFVEAKRILSTEKTSKEEERKASEYLFRSFRGLPKTSALIKFLSESGMRSVLQKTENYYLQDQQKEMHKIDEELFFVIDEKQNTVDLTEKGINLISEDVSDPNFFLLPDIALILSQIDQTPGEAEEKARMKEELMRDFNIKTDRIHTIQQLLKAYALFEKDKEYVVMEGKVKIVDEQTGRIMDGRRYSDGLHQAIEAKENVKVEAATQTYATVTLQNFFRMYHKLAGMTGTAETEAKEFWDIYKLDVVVIPPNRNIARKDLEDLVYKTKREKYNAVIDKVVELVNAGRPVLVGTTSVEISELLSRMLKVRNIRHQVLNAKLHQKEADIVAEAGKAGTVTIATNMAGRGTDIKLGEGVKEAGGLAIIGTERHESRRVDRQLRGRSGRQGDPGSSQFFVSLEDDLMRLFGSERISKLMDRMGHKEGEVITHSMITRSIERAQKKVEENNFGTRKRLLEFDDVMNLQREAVYKKRRNALYGERLGPAISGMMLNVCENILNTHQENRDYTAFSMDCYRALSIEPPFNEKDFMGESDETLLHALHHAGMQRLKQRTDAIVETVAPVLQRIFLEPNRPFDSILIPFTDGQKILQISAQIEKVHGNTELELVKLLRKSIILALIDNHWKEHLREMDDLKHSVYHAQYEQKDPLLVYKQESFVLFQDFLSKVNQDVLSFLQKATVHQEAAGKNAPVRNSPPINQPPPPQVQTGRGNVPGELPPMPEDSNQGNRRLRRQEKKK